jgi:hypothetical protein
MKSFVVLIALLVAFVSAALGHDMAKDSAAKEVMDAMDAIKADLASMKSSGNIDDKKLIESFRKAVALMTANLAKVPAGAQEIIKVHISDVEAKLKIMDQTGKFDESVLNKMQPPARN